MEPVPGSTREVLVVPGAASTSQIAANEGGVGLVTDRTAKGAPPVRCAGLASTPARTLDLRLAASLALDALGLRRVATGSFDVVRRGAGSRSRGPVTYM